MNYLGNLNDSSTIIEFELKKLALNGIPILLYDIDDHELKIHVKDDSRVIDIDWALKHHCPGAMKEFTVTYIVEKQ
ncbi:MAG: hypothetical protein JW881_21980 [Spirochaetales bacterium]|nr:hypothetical protein [Spirochaetales bacterium]